MFLVERKGVLGHGLQTCSLEALTQGPCRVSLSITLERGHLLVS